MRVASSSLRPSTFTGSSGSRYAAACKRDCRAGGPPRAKGADQSGAPLLSLLPRIWHGVELLLKILKPACNHFEWLCQVLERAVLACGWQQRHPQPRWSERGDRGVLSRPPFPPPRARTFRGVEWGSRVVPDSERLARCAHRLVHCFTRNLQGHHRTRSVMVACRSRQLFLAPCAG